MSETATGRATLAVDRWLSGLLRYDLSRQDVVKWVAFSRQLLAVMLVSVVSVAGLSAFISTREAQGLLEESLSAEGRAIANALARAAFVPLTLDDRNALAALLDAYHDVENVKTVRVRDPRGKIVQEMQRAAAGEAAVTVRAPVVPIADSEEPRSPAKELGAVEVALWSDRIKAKSRTIAWLNVLISGAMTVVISMIGSTMIRRLVSRLHELVGEANLVEQVRQTNAELEAFSYSVSHDLRAPLRSISGFSQVLLEDQSARLDESGKADLNRVVAAAKRMGELIDDLLELSRVARTKVMLSRVDLSAMARNVLEALRERDPGRRVSGLVKDRLVATGDPHLLRILLENLLGNAWKYSSKTPEACIELGAVGGDKGEVIFFVKDNGAGFDMAYRDKLFSPFQRLHASADFEGIGIGLATVQRIVRRHGGRIWAEAAVGKGATFFFTLA